MPQIDLYYSDSLLGHFTLIVHDKVELIAQRIHLVDRDAEASKGGKLLWAMHKIAQVTGFASSNLLSDIKSSPSGFSEYLNYQSVGRTKIKQWQITILQMDRMLNWVQDLLTLQSAGHYGSYGYVIYSNNVDNCGSFTVKCLAQAGIIVEIPALKSWLPMPSLIQQNM